MKLSHFLLFSAVVGFALAVPPLGLDGHDGAVLRHLLQSDTEEQGTVSTQVSDKADFFAESIVQPIVGSVPRMDVSGTMREADDVRVAFFSQLFAKSISNLTSDLESDCASASRDDSTLFCSYLDFAVVMFALGIIVPFFVFWGVFFFCWGRCICRCCCNNCGGKNPTKPYTPTARLCSLTCYVIGMVILIGFSCGGFLSTYQVGSEVDDLLTVMSDLTETPSRFLNETFDPSIAAVRTKAGTEFDRVNLFLTNISGSHPASMQSQLDGVKTSLAAMLTKLNTLSTSVTALPSQGSACSSGGCSCAQCSSLTSRVSGVQTTVDTVDLTKINKPLNKSSLLASLDEATVGPSNELRSLEDDLDKSFKGNIDQTRRDWADFEDVRTIASFALWGPVWALALWSVLALAHRGPGCFWCQYLSAFLLLFLFFHIYMVTFLPSLIFYDLCETLPVKGDTSSLIKRIFVDGGVPNGNRTLALFDTCLIAETPGNFFDGFNLNRSIVDDAFAEYNVDTMIPQSDRNTELDVERYLTTMTAINSDVATLTTTDIGYNDAAVATCRALIQTNYAMTTQPTLAQLGAPNGILDCSTPECCLIQDVDGCNIAGCCPTATNTENRNCWTILTYMYSLDAELTSLKSQSAQLVADMTTLNTTAAKIDSDIATMSTQLDAVVQVDLKQGVFDAANCKILQEQYDNVHTALCGSVTKSLNSIWFSSLVVAFTLVGVLICTMKAAKRLGKGLNRTRDASYKGRASTKGGKRRSKSGGKSSSSGKKRSHKRNKVAPKQSRTKK